jgi:hypothetical protein
MVTAAQSHRTRIWAIGRAGAMMRRPDPVDRSGRESDLLTDAQLAMRWQLSRGTLANQRSQGRVRPILSWPVESDTVDRTSKPTNRPDSCRASQLELHHLVTRVTCGKRWSASFDLLVPDTQGFQARGLEDACQVALVTLEVTAKVHACGHTHIGVP